MTILSVPGAQIGALYCGLLNCLFGPGLFMEMEKGAYTDKEGPKD